MNFPEVDADDDAFGRAVGTAFGRTADAVAVDVGAAVVEGWADGAGAVAIAVAAVVGSCAGVTAGGASMLALGTVVGADGVIGAEGEPFAKNTPATTTPIASPTTATPIAFPRDGALEVACSAAAARVSSPVAVRPFCVCPPGELVPLTPESEGRAPSCPRDAIVPSGP